jgi:alpha-glucosidase
MDYARPDELHQVFNFDFMVVAYDPSAIRKSINEVLSTVALVDAPATWVLSNHDSNRVVRRLGGGSQGLQRALVLAAIAHALPGGVYVYQGEELGLDDAEIADADRRDPIFARTQGRELGRDGGRVPLPWSAHSKNYGFSEADSVWLPQPPGWDSVAVDIQESNQQSVLHVYRNMLAQRRAVNTHASETDFEWLSCTSDAVCFQRGPKVFVYANPSDSVIHCTHNLRGGEVALQVGNVLFRDNEITLEPHSAAWYVLS